MCRRVGFFGDLSPALVTALFLLCPHMAFSAQVPGVPISSYKDTGPVGSGPSLAAHFDLVTSLKDPSPI